VAVVCFFDCEGSDGRKVGIFALSLLRRGGLAGVAAMPWHERWFELAKAKVARQVGLQLRKKFLFLPPLEPTTVMPADVTDLVGGVVMEFVLYLP
jgi:hypothetical protein